MKIANFRDHLIDLVMDNEDIDIDERFGLRDAILTWAQFDTAEGRASLPPDWQFSQNDRRNLAFFNEYSS